MSSNVMSFNLTLEIFLKNEIKYNCYIEEAKVYLDSLYLLAFQKVIIIYFREFSKRS
jgi:hypothetical protein